MLKMAEAQYKEGPGHYLRDWVYGANDGIITTFSIVSGVTGASLSPKVIVILGVANLLADGVSMAASNYLGMKSDIQASGGDVAMERPDKHAAATFFAFVVAGSFPLLPYMLTAISIDSRFGISIALSMVALSFVGGSRSFFTKAGYLMSALEMLAVGTVAGGLAYGIGMLGNWLLV